MIRMSGRVRICAKAMVAFVVAVALMLCLTGCGADLDKAERLTAEQAILQMGQARELTLKKALLSWGDRWDVYADGNLVATIAGEVLYRTDTYTMRSTNGAIICSEEEQESFVTARARKFDADGEVDGWFDQELTLWLVKIDVLDRDGRKVASVEQQLSLALNADVKDADGDVAWHLEKDLVSLDGATIHLTRREGTDAVDVRDAVMVSAVLNELTEPSDADGD